MIKVLIISYNALPLDVVSSYRAKAYCDHLYPHGIFPTLLTHRWEHEDGKYIQHDSSSSPAFEHNGFHRVIRLPYPGNVKSQSPLHTFLSYLRGNIDVDLEASYYIFRSFLNQHLEEEKYDLIISIFNPHFHLKLAYESWKRFKIPYILDFRDLWDNAIVTQSYKPSLKKKFLNYLIAYWWKRWIQSSLFFCTTGTKWKFFLENLTHMEGVIVRNGFENNWPARFTTTLKSKKFKVIHFGRIYPEQEIDVFVQGFTLFAQKCSPDDVGVEIIGLKELPGRDCQSFLKSALGPYVTFIPYLSKIDLMKYCQEEASLFFFPNFKEDNGQFSVKLYDYMKLRKPIIVSPGGGDIEQIISETESGIVLNAAYEINEYLHHAYNSFQTKGEVPLNNNEDLINQYSRQNQVRILAERINKEFSK